MTDFLADLGSTGHIIVGFVLVVVSGLRGAYGTASMEDVEMTAEQEVKKVYPDAYLAQSYGIDNMPNEYQVYRIKAGGKA